MARKLQEDQMSVRDVEAFFDVTKMTVFNWRVKPSKVLTPLPYHTVLKKERSAVIFYRSELLHWAAINKVPLADGSTPVINDDGDVEIKLLRKKVRRFPAIPTNRLSSVRTLTKVEVAQRARALLLGQESPDLEELP